MGIEIERKFLVKSDWMPEGSGTRFVQGYLHSGGNGATVRVRVAGDRAWLTVKGPSERGARLEYEYRIPVADAEEMLKELGTGHFVEKTRHLVDHEGHTWEVDVFDGVNDGLVVAEVELSSLDEEVELPSWVTEEVTGDSRYANAWLSIHPYSEWGGK